MEDSEEEDDPDPCGDSHSVSTAYTPSNSAVSLRDIDAVSTVYTPSSSVHNLGSEAEHYDDRYDWDSDAEPMPPLLELGDSLPPSCSCRSCESYDSDAPPSEWDRDWQFDREPYERRRHCHTSWSMTDFGGGQSSVSSASSVFSISEFFGQPEPAQEMVATDPTPSVSHLGTGPLALVDASEATNQSTRIIATIEWIDNILDLGGETIQGSAPVCEGVPRARAALELRKLQAFLHVHDGFTFAFDLSSPTRILQADSQTQTQTQTRSQTQAETQTQTQARSRRLFDAARAERRWKRWKRRWRRTWVASAQRMVVRAERWWIGVQTRVQRWTWTMTFIKACPSGTSQTGCRTMCGRSRRGGVAGILWLGGAGRAFLAEPTEAWGRWHKHRLFVLVSELTVTPAVAVDEDD